jgi:hypothetical protein
MDFREYRNSDDPVRSIFLDWRNQSLFVNARLDGAGSYNIRIMGFATDRGERIRYVPLEKRLRKNAKAFIRGCREMDNYVRFSSGISFAD